MKSEFFKFFTSVRFLLSITLFFGIAIQYAHKSDISIAIVCMINHTQAATQNSSSIMQSIQHTESQTYRATHCLFENKTEEHDPDGEYTWSKNIQEFILSSYFYGYIISQVKYQRLQSFVILNDN
jgi:ACS family sodium-dependent inorganic phosphate cotransporter-like MFS transporter 5